MKNNIFWQRARTVLPDIYIQRNRKQIMRTYTFFFLLLALFAAQPDAAHAQFAKRLKERAKQHAENKAIEKVIEKEDKAIDGVLGGGAPVATQDAEAESNAEVATAPGVAEKLKPGEGGWANYDFVPGERALYVDDFSDDKVGDFPHRLEFKSGSMEIIEWQGKRLLRSGNRGEFYINLSQTLPERFTMEFDFSGYGNGTTINFAGNESDYEHDAIELNGDRGGVSRKDGDAFGSHPYSLNEALGRIRVMADGAYVKVYSNEKRIANVPNANLGRANRIYVNVNAWSDDAPRLLGDIRIMAGGIELYDALYEALEAEGRITTQGIFFDTGSDVLRPESTPTLQEIGQTLKDHPDLRIAIEGHTDNVGSDASNQALSETRAAAVKAFLVAAYDLDENRMEAQGFGPSKPATSNDTPEGRQQNRRVELVKL